MLEEVVDYMEENGIEVNEVNYNLTLLEFIAENYINDLDIRPYVLNAANLLGVI
jgi:hypothetical protein